MTMTSTFGREFLEEISGSKPHSVRHPTMSNKFLEHRLDRGKVETDAGEVGMGAGGDGGYHALS